MPHVHDALQDAPVTATPEKSNAGAAAAAIVPFPSDALILLPVRDMVLFPGTVFPVEIKRSRAIDAAQKALREESQIGVLMQRDSAVVEPSPADFYRTGTVANILRYVTAPDSSHHLVLQGAQRFNVLDFIQEQPFLVARVQRIEDPEIRSQDIEARTHHLRGQAKEAIGLLANAPQEMIGAIESAAPEDLAYLVVAYLKIPPAEQQEILETTDLASRMNKIARHLAHRIEILRISREIGRQTKASLDARQRETILREQMAAIQRELGEGDGKAPEIAELSEAISGARMPAEVEEVARKELRRYERMPETAAEAGMARIHLDWLIEMPWALPEESAIDLAEARRILDEDHFGMEKIKRRIVEFLAVRKLAPEGKAPILCFVGPPGVGKTSLGKTIARAMGRAFVRVSLGGLHSEAEIRGHRRTYVGALPGNIVQAIRKAKSRNCVMMLDEIDKMSLGVQGDPAAAMLEVLDPEQNSTFSDNYLGVPFDLSRVVFIATANMLDSIPGPLLDRMEVISLACYTESDKLQIALRYLVRRQRAANGVKESQVRFDQDALREIIRAYTREAGVRNLERAIGKVLRFAAVLVADGVVEPIHITVDKLTEILGQPRFESEVAMRTSVSGVATGLAWTPFGGDILFIEATLTPGAGRLILTGQLGEVMRESAQAALSIVKNRAASLGIDATRFEKNDIHIHVPAGATPKDGPSAGVAIFTALVSLLTDRTVRSDTAMTGEISLRGLVLPVGGIKEKVVAAASAGLTRVMLPSRNRRDYDDIPEEARERLAFIWLERVDDAIDSALAEKAQGAP